jgi:hypothetical protein
MKTYTPLPPLLWQRGIVLLPVLLPVLQPVLLLFLFLPLLCQRFRLLIAKLVFYAGHLLSGGLFEIIYLKWQITAVNRRHLPLSNSHEL